MSTCGNRKFTGTMPDGKMKLYFKGGAFLGWSILGRMESEGGSLPFDVSARRTRNKRIT